jgi:hypothetical protein
LSIYLSEAKNLGVIPPSLHPRQTSRAGLDEGRDREIGRGKGMTDEMERKREQESDNMCESVRNSECESDSEREGEGDGARQGEGEEVGDVEQDGEGEGRNRDRVNRRRGIGS